MTNEEAIKHVENMKKGIFLFHPDELYVTINALEQGPCDELDFVQPHKKIAVNLEVCKMREATQEESEDEK